MRHVTLGGNGTIIYARRWIEYRGNVGSVILFVKCRRIVVKGVMYSFRFGLPLTEHVGKRVRD